MKKILITFGDSKYFGSMKKLEETAISIGKVDNVKKYTQDWLRNTEFWIRNQYILSRPRGAGYWIWKPFIILHTLESLNDGDIVMYSDAAVEIIDDLSPLFAIAGERDRVVFEIPGGHNNRTWTKRDCFILLGCDEEKYWNDLQLTATFSLWKKTEENIAFLKEYLRYLRDPRIVTDDPNMCGKPNFMEFRDHRHDQSVLSILTRKHNFERFCDPSQWGNTERSKYPNSPYGQLINHHRRKL
jgi:hypothetical protein